MNKLLAAANMFCVFVSIANNHLIVAGFNAACVVLMVLGYFGE